MSETITLRRMTGASPSPRHRLAAAHPHRIRGETPPQKLWLPAKLSMWGNDVNGDCVTAEEAFAKACYSPEIFISDSTVIAWASKHGVLNGANLDQVLGYMRSDGFTQDQSTYGDGPAAAVDWTSPAVLQNAISQGPVKIGVAAAQLQNVVGSANGWVATGFRTDQNLDHCVSLAGYGSLSWLAQQLGGTLPPGVDGSQPGYGLFTWSTVGIIDVPSMLAITGEAWLRNPTTLIVGPGPTPPYPPNPPLPPGPSPSPTLQQVVSAINTAFASFEGTIAPYWRRILVPVLEKCRTFTVQQVTRMWPSTILQCGLTTTGKIGALPPTVVEIIIGLVDGAIEAAKGQYPELAPVIDAVKPFIDAELRKLLSL